ncbi:MAG: GIY-YIG nuclease family protein [Planctomycetales bacterium]|nr:GIY-YIG nuclease family protein [Planctomycetales bacterium]MCA9904080.1 GIY-YIG nuclease family protein [Anaerolineae bacterium]
MTAKAEDPWFVYILRCADGSLYTGVTKDLERRLKQHNAGTASRYTRTRTPVTMLWHESAPSHGAALRRELEIKSLTRGQKESLVAGRNPEA